MAPRRPLRVAARALALVAVTAATMLPWWLGSGWAARRRERAWRWRCLWFGRWARGALRVLAVDLEVEGRVPEPPFLLVCNHLGYLDVPVLASRLDANFVAKADVAGWPLLGLLCRAMGTLWVDRRRRRNLPATLAAVQAELASGRGVVLFPEGTSSPGRHLQPFHPSLLVAAQRAGLPVAWAVLTYRTPPGELKAAHSVCWWGDMPFLAHLGSLLALPRIEARLRLGEEPVAAPDRKQLAHRLWETVNAGLHTDAAAFAAHH